MSVRIERYIFGSVRGYGQLARSSGISEADAQRFDTISFGFGQVGDPSFAASLLDRPAFFTHAVPGGRWTVARVLPGKPDDNGRPTLLIIWLVFTSGDWEGTLGYNPRVLLETASLWLYDGESKLPVLEIKLPPGVPPARHELPDRLSQLLKDVRRNLTANRSTVVSADDYTIDEICKVVAAAPPAIQIRMTFAHRCLSKKFPVVINLVANGSGSMTGSRVLAGVSLSDAVQDLGSEFDPAGIETDPSILKSKRTVTEGRALPPVPAVVPIPRMFNPAMFVLAVMAVVGPIVSYIVAHNQAQARMDSLQRDQLAEGKRRDEAEKIATIELQHDLDAERKQREGFSDAHEKAITQLSNKSVEYDKLDGKISEGGRQSDANRLKIDRIENEMHDLEKKVEANADAVKMALKNGDKSATTQSSNPQGKGSQK